MTCFRVDLDDRDVTTEGERTVGLEVDLREQWRVGGRRSDPRHRRRGNAVHAEPSVVEHDDVVGGRFEQVRDRVRACASTSSAARSPRARQLQRPRTRTCRRRVGTARYRSARPHAFEGDARH